MEEVTHTVTRTFTPGFILLVRDTVACLNADEVGIGNRLCPPGQAMLIGARGDAPVVRLTFLLFDPGEDLHGGVPLDWYRSAPFAPLLHPDHLPAQ